MGNWSTDLFDLTTSVEPLKTEAANKTKAKKEGFGKNDKLGDTIRDKEEGNNI